MEEEHNHFIELSPEEISLSLENPEATFSILNLTLQYVPYKILSPNPLIFNIQPSEGILDPCDSIDITVKGIIYSSLNFQAFEKNNKLTILSHENQDIEWNQLKVDEIQRHDLHINIQKCLNPQKQIEDNILIAQIYNQFTFSEDDKRIIIDHIMEKYGKTTKYHLSNTMMMFHYPKQEIRGDIHLITTQQNYVILRTYTPAMYLNTPPKYPTEPMSPQYIKPKIQKPKVEEQIVEKKVTKSSIILRKNKQSQQLQAPPPLIQSQSQPLQEINEQEKQDKQDKLEIQEIQENQEKQENKEQQILQTPEQQQQPSITNSDQQVYQDLITQLNQKPQISQFSNDSPKKPLRPYQSEIIPVKDLEQFKQQYQKPRRKLQMKQNIQNLAPIEIEKNQELKKSSSEFNPPKFKQLSKFNTYSKICYFVLFKDHSYLLTVSDKEVITVWNLSLNSEEGKIRDHSEMKKQRLIQIYEWVDSQERRFATLATDNLIRIFSIEEMRLKFIFKIDDYSEITSIAFLPDKEQVCIAGTPLKTFNLFGSKLPKYRYFRLYNVRSLKEILSEKIPAVDGQILQPVEYTDNENMKHSRLNNILVVNKGFRDREGGELLFFMIDMNDKCTKILTLTFEQIQIYSVKSLYYLPTKGSFVVVEKNKSNSYQQNKIFVINVKQLQTDDGLKNGIVLKQFDESSVLDDEIYVLSKQEYILKVKGDVVQLIDLKTESQINLTITQQMGDNPQNYVQSGKIIRIEGETLQILDMLI